MRKIIHKDTQKMPLWFPHLWCAGCILLRIEPTEWLHNLFALPCIYPVFSSLAHKAMVSVCASAPARTCTFRSKHAHLCISSCPVSIFALCSSAVQCTPCVEKGSRREGEAGETGWVTMCAASLPDMGLDGLSPEVAAAVEWVCTIFRHSGGKKVRHAECLMVVGWGMCCAGW